MSRISVTREERIVQVTQSTDRIVSVAAVGPQGPAGPAGASTFTALTDTPGSIADGQYLVGSSGSLAFIASVPAADVSGLATVATTGGYSDLSGVPATFPPDTHSLNTHSDVSISLPSSAQVLRFDGAQWVNGVPPAIGTGTELQHRSAGDLAAVTGTSFALGVLTLGPTGGVVINGQSDTSLSVGSSVGGSESVRVQHSASSNGQVDIVASGTGDPIVSFRAASLGGQVRFTGPDIPSDLDFTLPTSDGSPNHVLTTDGAGQLTFRSPGGVTPPRSVNASFRAPGGGDLAVGTKVYVLVPYAGTIQAVRLIADAVSSVTIGVKSVSFSGYTAPGDLASITGGTDPTLSSAIKSSTNLSSWSTSLAANTVLELEITAQSSGLSTLSLHMEIQPS